MFKLALSPSYRYPVTVELPGGDKHAIEAVFKRLPQADVESLYRDLAAGDLSEEDLLHRVLVGWDKVCDEDGSALAFNPQNLARLLAVFPMRGTLTTAWVESLAGARAKNSLTPPATGRRE